MFLQILFCKQSVKLRNGLIKFNNHSKQLAVPFKTFADFESVLKRVKNPNEDCKYTRTEKYRKHISCSFAYKIVCIDDRFIKPIALYRLKDVVNRFITEILFEYKYCRGVVKKTLTKILS